MNTVKRFKLTLIQQDQQWFVCYRERKNQPMRRLTVRASASEAAQAARVIARAKPWMYLFHEGQ